MVGNETFININTSRISSENRMISLLQFLMIFQPGVVCIQEIDVVAGMKFFKKDYQVFCNYDHNSNNHIGIMTIVKKGVNIIESLVGYNGRILGLKLKDIQIWNVYPPSGTENKNKRETFFREDLCNLMMNWKDHSKFVFQMGDHNCTHRMEDSLNNGGQHLQPGLVAHLRINGLKDDFLEVNGKQVIEYSRVTEKSKTRIDYIFSNTSLCRKSYYIDTKLKFDHFAVVGEYEMDLMTEKEVIPQERLFKSWVIPKHLEKDKVFVKDAKEVYDKIHEDIGEDEMFNDEVDYTWYWVAAKKIIKKIARNREREIRKKEEERVNYLQIFYLANIFKIEEGKDCKRELNEIKKELNDIYKERSEKAINKMRGLLVEDHVYDINKLQKERKYENQKSIKDIKIGEDIFTGTEEVVKAIERKMQGELKVFAGPERDDPVTEEEKRFLDLIPETTWTNEEKEILIGPTTEEEINEILNFEVDLDSSPGEDGITFRFIRAFWKFSSYRYLYLKFLNYTREIKEMGYENNIGVMVVKNKNAQSIEYDKKRKLTKINKDSNMGHGKVWTNRMKKIVLPKILPKCQFNCQDDLNIIDEVREIRSVNQFLLGNDEFGQINGTILSIDFNNAYRSTSLRWFDLVMRRFNIPAEFVEWFWTMYRKLGVMVVINRYKSDILQVKRGFMEGHPPSMAAFVVTMIPLMKALEMVVSGITTPDDQVHKVKVFADDLKLFLGNLEEIKDCYDMIEGFEKISGLKMHRDPARRKCQALPFGRHVEYDNWPEWITVQKAIKVVGIYFTNERESFESMNTDLVAQNFYNALQKVQGMRGTVFQKVYVVNTFLFTKLWYVSQVVKMGKKTMEKILGRAMAFIYGGENERPVRALNFRDKDQGGLGLICPILKAKAFLVKNMMKDFLKYDCEIDDGYMMDNIYGYFDDFKNIYMTGLGDESVKVIYQHMVKGIVEKNGSLIPSRSEKRNENIKWNVTWKNLKMLKGITAEEKMFGWKVTQDMVAVGSRIHRKVDKRCLRNIPSKGECQIIPDLTHHLAECEAVKNGFEAIKEIVENMLEKKVETKNIILLNFNHRKRKRLKLVLWFVVKSLYLIHLQKFFNKDQLLCEIRKEVDWNLKNMRIIGALDDMQLLRLKLAK